MFKKVVALNATDIRQFLQKKSLKNLGPGAGDLDG
jgi:hypothetical protein